MLLTVLLLNVHPEPPPLELRVHVSTCPRRSILHAQPGAPCQGPMRVAPILPPVPHSFFWPWAPPRLHLQGHRALLRFQSTLNL